MSDPDYTSEQVMVVLRAAFAPLECRAEQIGSTGMRFKVVMPSGSNIERATSYMYPYQHRSKLQHEIHMVRREIETKGIALDIWTMPPAVANAA